MAIDATPVFKPADKSKAFEYLQERLKFVRTGKYLSGLMDELGSDFWAMKYRNESIHLLKEAIKKLT